MNQQQSTDYQEKLAAKSKKLFTCFFGWFFFGAVAIYQGWATDDNQMVVDAILLFGLAGLTWDVAILNATVNGILGELNSQAKKDSNSNET